MEEERQSIIHEPRADASRGDIPRLREVDARRDGGAHEVTSATLPSPRAEPLSALIARAQALLSRPLPVEESGSWRADDRGGGAQRDEETGSSCRNQSVCGVVFDDDDRTPHLGEDALDVPSKQSEYAEMMCKVDERWPAPCGPHRGEV